MAVAITYDREGKMNIEGLECGCPLPHNRPDQDIYVGAGLIGRIPEYIRRRGLGAHCVLVADGNTYELAGRAVETALVSAGFAVVRCVIRRAGDMEPDEVACGEVLLSIQPETEFLISVGSGSITDITRVNAMRTRLPFVCVGTAPSMDGYTSVVAPLLLRGAKIHRAAVCPEIIVCDIDVLKTAPLSMVVGGVGDVLGKYIARADWMLGAIINDEPYCPVCGEIVMNAVDRLLNNVSEIRARSEQGIRVLIEALLLAGVTIMIVGHTRAVASIEHNIVHYWDMMKLKGGERPPSHGAAVGASTLMVWPLYERFAREDLSRLDLDDIQSARIGREARERYMVEAYGEEAALDIMRENPQDFLSWEEQYRRFTRARERFVEIQAVIAELPPLSRVERAMRDLGAPMIPGDLGIGRALVAKSLRCGKDYRARYSLFKLLDECGLLESYLADYPMD